MPPRHLPKGAGPDYDAHLWGRSVHQCLEQERAEYERCQDRSGVTPVRFGALVRMLARSKSPDKPPPSYFFLACAKSISDALHPHAPPPPPEPPPAFIDWDEIT